MNGKIIIAVRALLLVIAIFLGYQIYRVIMEPIEFERIQTERYAKVINRLEHIRDAQKVYKSVYGEYQPNLNNLIAFIDTGSVDIVERKDSSFMRYDPVYQTDMVQDTVIKRVIGQESVKERLFGPEYNPERLRYIPHSDNEEFYMDATSIVKNGITVPVFEAAAKNSAIFKDLLESGQYEYFIDENYALIVGSLSEPTLSGNWK